MADRSKRVDGGAGRVEAAVVVHVGKVVRRDGSGSKWKLVRCSCGWSSKGNGVSRAEFERRWRAHIRELGGKPSMSMTAETPGEVKRG